MTRKKSNIPKTAERITGIIFKPGINKYASGDLEEEFHLILKESGKRKALFWYWKQVLLSAFPYIRKNIIWNIIMYKNYIKIAWRNLLKHKSYSLINISGLTIGMSLSLLIAVLVMWEISYDKFHENTDRLYRITELLFHENYTQNVHQTAVPVGPLLKDTYPEVVNSSRFTGLGEMLFYYEDKRFYEYSIAADRSLFTMLTFPIIKGTVLSEPNSILIDETTAEKFFGASDPVGKHVTVDNQYTFVVAGIFEDIPKNSTYQFHIVLPFEFMQNFEWFHENNWSNHRYTTFIMLDEKTDAEEINSKIINTVNDHYDEMRIDIALQSFKDIHLNTEVNGPSAFFAFFFSRS